MYADKIKLYRGDGQEIDEFKFHKTYKHCLVGQGIYLTSKVAVAESYRTKGMRNIFPEFELYDGPALNRLEAYDKGFAEFAKHWILRKGLSDKWYQYRLNKKEEAQARIDYRNAIDEKLVTSDYGVSRQAGKSVRGIKVTLHKSYGKEVGHLSHFEFNKSEFEASAIKIDGRITDTYFWELMYDHHVGYGEHRETKESFIKYNSCTSTSVNDAKTFRTVFGIRQTNYIETGLVWKRMRSVLEKYAGIKGLEYNGGIMIGGSGRHRAFCMWDEEYINDHRV